ncbi:glycosyltransferase [Crystallibacter degradans]|uniref:glycosyltransferase n=1 Tax=Crystallibacter degradans TaxID=2726743 RepID=UPI001473FFD5|nr:glycosyltransferase [Arthrobacter sp. SF27]NMR28218.1 glycosyltransferase family 4 protein [Arthrobacter sp. SF27]
MKVLVCPHQMVMGGSQLNAVEMAARVRKQGHEPLIYAPQGVLVSSVRAMGLEYVEAPEPVPGLSREWMRRLSRLVKERDIDLVHAYEWAPCIEATFSAGLRQRVPVLMSVMAMDVPEFLPRHLPLIVGTPALAARSRSEGRQAYLLEPPVDMSHNRTTDVEAARRQWEIEPRELVVSTVTMLTTELEKLQGVLALIAMADRLGDRYPLRLLVAGDGEGLEQVSLRAKRVNERHGRTVVDVLGFLADPATVYEAADVVVGMGTSAIKGLAFEKPLIVHGEGGFWQVADPESSQQFLQEGWFGANGNGAKDLEAALVKLLDHPQLRSDLGSYGRHLVKRRYSLKVASRELSGIYDEVASSHPSFSRTVSSLVRSAVGVTRFRASMLTGNPVRQQQWSHSGVAL